MKVVKPLNLNGDITISDKQLLCEVDPDNVFTSGRKIFTIEDYIPEVKKGRWIDRYFESFFLDAAGKPFAIIHRYGYCCKASIENSGERGKEFDTYAEAVDFVEENYKNYALSLIDYKEKTYIDKEKRMLPNEDDLKKALELDRQEEYAVKKLLDHIIPDLPPAETFVNFVEDSKGNMIPSSWSGMAVKKDGDNENKKASNYSEMSAEERKECLRRYYKEKESEK